MLPSVTLPATAWFAHVAGVNERTWLAAHRGTALEEGAPVGGDASWGPHLLVRNMRDASLWDGGAFRVWSLAELEARAPHPTPRSDGGPLIEIHLRDESCERDDCLQFVESSSLQANAQSGTMFQVASNFNTSELPNHRVAVDSGEFLEHLMTDATQGPACTSGAGVSAITRIHALYRGDGSAPPHTWGQTSARHVELLGAPSLTPHFPVTNGKLLVLRRAHGAPPPPPWPLENTPA